MGIYDKLFGKKDILSEYLKAVDEKAELNRESGEAGKSLAKELFIKGYARIEMCIDEEGIKYLDKALKIDPQCAAALNGKGMGLSGLGRYEEAIRCFDRALEIKPQFAWCWTQKGITLNKLSKNEEAIKCYDKALEIDPENDFVLEHKRKTLKKLGRHE